MDLVKISHYPVEISLKVYLLLEEKTECYNFANISELDSFSKYYFYVIEGYKMDIDLLEDSISISKWDDEPYESFQDSLNTIMDLISNQLED